MNAAIDLPRIPLSALHLSPLNARKVRPNDIDSLAASIAAHGLLQNLTVTVNSKPGEYEVVAGGRRLAAMQMLAQQGRLPEPLARDGIPCLVIEDNDVAHEASTAENTLREAMHPADQYEAFRRMIDAGKPIADVAAHFGTSEHVVRQRLKLANVHPQLLQIYREGGMQLDQLQALALTDDHEQQRKAWFGAKQDWQRTARDIRERITKREVGPDNPLVKFVGIEAYEQAGGPVRRDMFSGEVYLGDRALLDKLALDKLEVEAERYRSEGWSWVEVHLTLDYEELSHYRISGIEPKHEKPTAADLARIKEIDARRKAIHSGQDTLDDDSPEWEALEREDDALYAERQRLVAGKQIWSDDAKEKTGVLIWIDRHTDGMRVACGRLRPGQRMAASGISSTVGTASGTKAKAKKPELSAAIRSVLSAHRSAAAAHHVARDPMLATCLLVERLLQSFWTGVYSTNAIKIRWEEERGHTKVAPSIDKALIEPLAKARKALNDIPKRDTLSWLLKQPEEFQRATLAALVALSFDGITDSPKGNSCVDAVHSAVGIDMAKHWTATCDGFLTRIPGALIIEAVAEACGKEQAAKVSAAKGKEGRAAEAAKLLNGTGWLPKPLRGHGYKTGTVKAAAAPAKKAGKKAPQKKSPSKRAPAKKE